MKSVHFFIGFLLFTQIISAQIPRTISYQGVLTDGSGSPKPDGSYSITFSFYETGTDANALWSENKTLAVTKGLFSTYLGDQVPFGASVKFDKPYWLGIKVADETELSPRIRLSSSGYSITSIYSDTAKNITDGKVVKSIMGLKDNVIIEGDGGTTVNTEGNKIKITSNGGGGSGIQGVQNSNNTLEITNPTGPTATMNIKVPLSLNGSAEGGNYILTSENTGSGNGIQGIAGGNSGQTIGVVGNSESPEGYGVSGWNLATSGYAVGLFGRSNSPNGIAIWGDGKSAGTGTGVYGESDSWVGVWGQSRVSSGVVGKSTDWIANYGESVNSVGVQGNSTNNTGVVGYSENWVGVYGVGVDGNGVWGKSSFSNGVYGESTFGHSVVGTSRWGAFGALGFYQENGDFGYGVYGQQGGTNLDYAGFFQGSLVVNQGKLIVSGDLAVSGSKNFKIDHPLDPENKYLIHSCVESSERKNFYDGTVVTSSEGLATVQLPDYFQALNRDYRYQLTVIGEFAQAIILNEIQNSRFTIKTDKPGVKVSWLVTGIRNDEYAKQNPFETEQEKDKTEKGKFLMPELYGQHEEKAINYVKKIKPMDESEKRNVLKNIRMEMPVGKSQK